jgi:thiol-disulfide isomerase/thioredoxin
MRTLRPVLGGLLPALLLASAAGPTAGQSTDGQVSVRTVNYEELGKLIRGLKGKVVVVDFWADFCIPCKKEFPNLVQLHRKYGKDGLAAVSVSLDNPADQAARGRVEKFLARQGATFTNLLLNEKPEEWQKQLKIDGPPCVYVFHRDGTIALKQSGDQVNYEKVGQEVAKLLGK